MGPRETREARRLMVKLGMGRLPEPDFAHPDLPTERLLRLHVTCAIARPLPEHKDRQ